MRLRVLVLGGVLGFGALCACSGERFSSGSSGGSGGSGSGGGGTLPDGGAPDVAVADSGGGRRSCQGPTDCDDGDPCTVDLCGPDSLCMKDLPACGPTQRCCDGLCGACCSAQDCDDGIDCTIDECTGNACAHTPDDSVCGEGSYCSSTQGCRTREYCEAGTSCDDENPCTTDYCAESESLCAHDPCEQGTLCCPGVGCAACCSDSQCEDGDPCTRNTCVGGTCVKAPLCGDEQQCCASGGTASCGTCCSANDCDDGIACTVDSCAGGSCSRIADSSLCPQGYSCDPSAGCVKTAECGGPGDCPPLDCQVANCRSGKCEYEPLSCGTGTTCCGGQVCQECCNSGNCNDGIDCTSDTCEAGTCRHTPNDAYCKEVSKSGFCSAEKGCIQCRSNTDCDDGNACTQDVCTQNGACTHLYTVCGIGQICCPSTGLCQQCCNSCDCTGIVLPAGEYEPNAPIPPLCGTCVNGTCENTTTCGCLAEAAAE